MPGQRERPTPAIAMSAQALPYQRKEALEAGSDVFLDEAHRPPRGRLLRPRALRPPGVDGNT